MELQPVRRVRKPVYPTRADLLRHPRRARRLLAPRPSLGTELATAAGMLVAMGLAGCRERPSGGSDIPPIDWSRVDARAVATAYEPTVPAPDPTSGPPPGTTVPEPTLRHSPRGGIELAHTVVAPVFEFGDGRGSVGCVVVAPPAFLSEEEAMIVIKEELAEHGIEIGPGGSLAGVTVSPRIRTVQGDDFESWDDYYDMREDPWVRGALEIDGTDGEARVSVVFVSQEDYSSVGIAGSSRVRVDARGQVPAEPQLYASSVTSYDFREAAHYVASRAAESGLAPVRLGVFYDPIPSSRWVESVGAEAREAELKKGALDLLRRQVRSFATWLDEQDALG